MKDHHGCPIQATSNVISGKWKVLILWHLSFRSHRFSELRGSLHGVSEKVLTAQLRELQADGLVVRTSARTVPPRVDYRLSPAGEELIPIMERMCDWAGVHLGVMPNLPLRGAKMAASTHLATEALKAAAGPGATFRT
jgi:DNA-binding HxlR family transcriptional regulator